MLLAGLCSGSTADSDSVCEGSNPSPAAILCDQNRYRTEKPRNLNGSWAFSCPFFECEFCRYPEDVRRIRTLTPRFFELFQGRFCGFFREICPFFVALFVKFSCLGAKTRFLFSFFRAGWLYGSFHRVSPLFLFLPKFKPGRYPYDPCNHQKRKKHPQH